MMTKLNLFKKTSNMPLQKFVIKDWTGTTMDFGLFDSFDEALSFLIKKFPNDEDLQEYFIELIEDN